MVSFMSSCTCIRCGTEYHPHLVNWVFRVGQRPELLCPDFRKRVCRACEQARRDRRKQRDRWTMKARDVIRRHAARLGVARDILITVYGWDPRRLAHDAEHQYSNGCNYCGEPYAAMGRGLGSITLDIQDRDRPPYYCTNTKWCCLDCNRRKGAMTPEAFEFNRQMWNLWKLSRTELRGEQGVLF